MNQLSLPRTIDPSKTFNALVQWFHDELIVQRNAPGLVIGLSGTDSIVSFLAAYKAFEKAGKPARVWGIHFAPSDDFLYDHPEAEIHLWFSKQVIPWLREQAPHAPITVDTSIDWRCDGLRWGSIADMSVVSNDHRGRTMRLPEDQYWVVGTRNRSEDTLLAFSNASMLASAQPLIHLWKSEVLQISEYLKVPPVALAKSCETDCICGRLRLPASHIREVDLLLMVRRGELLAKYAEDNIPEELRRLLSKFIDSQISNASFKRNIPYIPKPWSINDMEWIVFEFENGTINLKEFNHRKHLYIAWTYLKAMSYMEAVDRYVKYLRPLLDSAGQSHRFSLDVTCSYLLRLDKAIKQYPAANFDELVLKVPSVLEKISA